MLRVVYCQSCKAIYIPVETIMHVTFDPASWDLCASSESCSDMLVVALHAIKETILDFYRVKKEYKKLVDTVK